MVLKSTTKGAHPVFKLLDQSGLRTAFALVTGDVQVTATVHYDAREESNDTTYVVLCDHRTDNRVGFSYADFLRMVESVNRAVA
jgi:hypothetical protein